MCLFVSGGGYRCGYRIETGGDGLYRSRGNTEGRPAEKDTGRQKRQKTGAWDERTVDVPGKTGAGSNRGKRQKR